MRTISIFSIFLLTVFTLLTPSSGSCDVWSSPTVTFDWPSSNLPDSFILYQNGENVCEVTFDLVTDLGDSSYSIVCPDIFLTSVAPMSFTISAVIDGVEGDPSSPFELTLPPQDDSGNYLPTAAIDASTLSGQAPLTIDFDGSRSLDVDGETLDYEWLFGDGGSSFQQAPSYTFSFAGTYTVELKVIDEFDAFDTTTVTVVVTEEDAAPLPDNTLPTAAIDYSQATVGATYVNFYGDLSDDPDGTIESYVWNFGDGSGSASGQNVGHEYSQPGTYSATLTVTDDQGGTDQSQAQVTVSPQDTGTNQPPTAVISAYSGTSGQAPFTVILGANQSSDPDGTISSISWNFGEGSTSTGLTLVSHSFTSAGQYTVTLTVTDDQGATSTDTITISATSSTTNTAPTVTSGALSVNQGSSDTGILSGSDPDGDSLTFSIVTNGSKGTAVITNTTTGSYTYTPDNGQSGSDSFTFRVTDGTDYSSTATISVTIIEVNTAPVASGASISVEEGSTVSGTLVSSDAEGDSLTFSIVSNGSKGTATITDSAAGSYIYAADSGQTGADSFSYRVFDGTDYSDTASVSVTINEVNIAPVASNATLTVAQGTTATGILAASDSNGDSLTYAIIINGSMGTATITDSATGSFTYTPSNGMSGSDSFTFMVSDGTANSNMATVSVTIIEGNTAPAASNATLTVAQGNTGSGTLTTSDPDGDNLTYSIVTNGAKGIATITDSVNGTYTYTPDSGQTGSDSFTYRVSDGSTYSNTATVSITIVEGNNSPVATDSSLPVIQDGAAAGTLLASDADWDSLTYTIVTPPSKGTVTITNSTNGSYTYAASSGQTGSDSFTFQVSDGTVFSNIGTIYVTITSINQPPVAAGGAMIVNENSSITAILSASDANGDSLTYTIVSNGTLGTATISDSATGTFTYTPRTDVSGIDTFTFKANDGEEDSNVETITITINSINDAPVASDSSTSLTVGGSVTGILQAEDPEGETISWAIVSGPTKGQVSLDWQTGSYTYTSTTGESGTDTFTFWVTDGADYSNVATITVTIEDVPIPVAPSLISPTKVIDQPAPVFQWHAVQNATQYRLILKSQVVLIDKTYNSDEICDSSTGLCSVSEPLPRLSKEVARSKLLWKVQGGNASGFGEWSDNMQVRVAPSVARSLK